MIVDPRLLFVASASSLVALARRARARGLTRHEFVVVCIDVDCRTWARLVEEVMAGPDWYADRTCGEGPTVRGTVPRTGFVERLVGLAPGLSRALRSRPSPGAAHAVSMGTRGGKPCASVYAITLNAESS
jgi:hypothetical protein